MTVRTRMRIIKSTNLHTKRINNWLISKVFPSNCIPCPYSAPSCATRCSARFPAFWMVRIQTRQKKWNPTAHLRRFYSKKTATWPAPFCNAYWITKTRMCSNPRAGRKYRRSLRRACSGSLPCWKNWRISPPKSCGIPPAGTANCPTGQTPPNRLRRHTGSAWVPFQQKDTAYSAGRTCSSWKPEIWRPWFCPTPSHCPSSKAMSANGTQLYRTHCSCLRKNLRQTYCCTGMPERENHPP